MAVRKKKNKDKDGKLEWITAIEKASTLSMTIVFFPVAFLIIGVWLDKRFESTPLFILIGIVTGVVLGMYVFIKKGKEIKSNGS